MDTWVHLLVSKPHTCEGSHQLTGASVSSCFQLLPTTSSWPLPAPGVPLVFSHQVFVENLGVVWVWGRFPQRSV